METSTRTALAACNLCEAICGLELTIEAAEGPKVLSIRGNAADPLSRGHICPKALRSRTSTRTPTGCAARCGRPAAAGARSPGTRRSTSSPPGWPRAARARRRRGRRLPGQPQRAQPRRADPRRPMLDAAGTRNRFCATSVDQLPHQFVAWLLYGHQFLLPIAGHRPHRLLPGLRRQPDGLQRLADDRARLPRPAAGAAARGGRMVVFDPRRTETAKVADEHHFVRPGTDAGVLLALVHVLWRRGARRPAGVRRRAGDGARGGRRFTPERAAAVTRRARGDDPPHRAGARRGRRRLPLRPDGRVHPGLRHAVPVGGPAAQHPHRQPRPARRRDVHPSPRSTRRRGDRRPRPLRQLAQPRARAAGVRRRAAGLRRSPRRSSTPGEGQIRAMLTSPATRCCPRPAATGSTRRWPAWTSWSPSTSTSTRPPGTPTSSCRRPRRSSATTTTWCSTLLAVRNTARFTPAVFAKPADARHDWEIFRELALRTAARLDRKKPWRRRLTERARLASSPTRSSTVLLLAGPASSMRALRAQPGRHRPRPAAAGDCPAGCRRRTSGSTSRPTLVLADLRAAARRARGARRRRAAADRPSAPARQQLLDAQHRPADQGPAAPPPADAPRRPGRARHRRRHRRCGWPRGSAR